jgi:hypothetical protein
VRKNEKKKKVLSHKPRKKITSKMKEWTSLYNRGGQHSIFMEDTEPEWSDWGVDIAD